MKNQDSSLRAVASMRGIWRPNHLADFISTVDDPLSRSTAACTLVDLVRRDNEELASLQAMGLYRPAMSPCQGYPSRPQELSEDCELPQGESGLYPGNLAERHNSTPLTT